MLKTQGIISKSDRYQPYKGTGFLISSLKNNLVPHLIHLRNNSVYRLTCYLLSEMVYRKRDLPLTNHYLLQLYMGFAMTPPLQETGSSLQSIHSNGKNELDHRL